MKIRYFLITLLSIGLLTYGMFRLVIATLERSALPVPVAVPAPLADADNTAPPTQAVPASGTATATPVPASLADADNTAPPTQAVPASGTATADADNTALDAVKQWGERTKGVVRRVKMQNDGTRTLFLTVNAYVNNNPAVMESLAANNIKATIFVSGYFARRHTNVVKQWSGNPLFDIQNLGNRSRSLASQGQTVYNVEGTKNVTEALNEVTAGAASIAAITGKTPVYYRSATGYTDNVAVAAVNAKGFKVIGYDVVTDGGGSLSSEQIKNNILNAASGSIIVISINPGYPNIMNGLQAALDEIKAKQLPVRFEQLSDYETAFELF